MGIDGIVGWVFKVESNDDVFEDNTAASPLFLSLSKVWGSESLRAPGWKNCPGVVHEDVNAKGPEVDNSVDVSGLA